MDYSYFEWRDIDHYFSGEKPVIRKSWFHGSPVNIILSIREGRETEADFVKRRALTATS